MEYIVFKAYDNAFDRILPSWHEVTKFIGSKARKHNYGIFRQWEQDGVYYFDIGPTVYKVIQKI